MKLVSFAIPCYNSYAYMGKCIESLLPGGDDVEIIIVDDGSMDSTGDIADEYARHYPGIIKVIHKENGGHGSAVNAGLEAATGLYYKVVDSDDWVDPEAYRQVIATLKRLISEGTPVDMLLTNYVYEKISTDQHRKMFYGPLFPKNEVIGWDGMKHNIRGFSILMHSVTYRTEMLHECGLKLPEHTFYVDNLFVYIPLPYVKTLYYLDVDFYRYFIGREGQSVTEQIMVSRIDQQLKVNYLMIDAYNLYDEPLEEHLRKYMLSYLETITVVSSAIGYVSKDPVNVAKVKKLWKYIKNKDIRTYRHLRYGVMGGSMNLPGRLGRYLSVKAYKVTQRIIGFN